MQAQSIDTNIPKLRFPEFSRGWKKDRLDNLASVNRGKFSVRPRNDPRYFGGDIPFVQTGEVVGAKRFLTKYSQTLNELGLSVSRAFPANTILITIAANIGDVAITKFRVACPDSLVGIIPKKDHSVGFLYEALKLQKNNLESCATQNAQANINLQVLNPLIICLPEKEEQQKIASFLGAVDDKIAGLQKKKDLLDAYKKGMMQRLFSQSLRFTDANSNPFPDWEEKSIDNLFSSTKGYGLSKGDLDGDGQYPCVLYGELYTTYNEAITHIKSYTNKHDGKPSQKGDLLIPCSTTTTGIDLANITLMPHDNVLLGGDITIMRAKQKIDSLFYAYYLTNHQKFEIAKYAQGITIVHLYFNHIKKMVIDYPHPDEQKKIADFLSAIDDKIALVSNELSHAKTFKKGLLQQMFV
jgi:type I restriction enzyme S subunit